MVKIHPAQNFTTNKVDLTSLGHFDVFLVELRYVLAVYLRQYENTFYKVKALLIRKMTNELSKYNKGKCAWVYTVSTSRLQVIPSISCSAWLSLSALPSLWVVYHLIPHFFFLHLQFSLICLAGMGSMHLCQPGICRGNGWCNNHRETMLSNRREKVLLLNH